MWTQNSLEASGTGRNNRFCGEGGQTLEKDIPVTQRAWSLTWPSITLNIFYTYKWNKPEETSGAFDCGVSTEAEAGVGPHFDTQMVGHTAVTSQKSKKGTLCQLLEAEKPEEPQHLLEEMVRLPGQGCLSMPCCPVSSSLWPCEARTARAPVSSQEGVCP